MGKHLLLAEDDFAIASVISEILKDEGFSVIRAESGAEALRLATSKTPFLILLDISLGTSDGKVTAKKLKANSNTQNIPLILISANTGTKKIAEEVKADGFLLKPFDIDDLVAIVKQYA